MKGIRYYALLSTLSLAATIGMPALVLADEAQPSGQERGIRLDELFTMFQKPALSSQSLAKAAGTATKPQETGHKTTAIAQAHVPAKTHKSAATTVAKNPVPAKGDDQLAVYKGGSGGNSMVAVSHTVVSNSSTNVIAATLDRPGAVPKYKAGDHMTIKLKAIQDCNVVVFDFDANGQLTQLFPNTFDKDASMHAGQTVELGGDSSEYTLDIDGKGMERIFVYAYPLSEGTITVAMNPLPNTPFRAVNITTEQYNRLIAQSRNYFDKGATIASSETRGVKVTGKSSSMQPVSDVQSDKPANKLELVFQIDK